MEAAGVSERFYARVMRIPGIGVMASIADIDAVGRVEEDEDRGIVVSVPREFYGDRLISLDEARRLLESAEVLVLAGSRIINIAIELGLVNPDSVLEVNGLMHVQVYKFRF